ncbi:MAG: T9SS type A sorting domain-containing protein [Flavobacteriales bacterium]|nr:T9SS type A sorting domain-containing protein [Flavobacteriales bacterium]
MKPSTPLLPLLFVATAGIASAQVQWSWARNGIGEGYDQVLAVTTDPAGNVIAVGEFTSATIAFGAFTLTNNAAGDDDLFVVKYDPAGTVLWARSAGAGLDDKATAVATDAAGNVYMTGYFYSPSITFGAFTLTNAGNVGDVCVVKYDPDGNVLWATREGGPALEIPYAIAVDDQQNIVVAGRFSSNTLTIGTTTLTQAGSMDVFVVKYGAAGNVLWAKGAGGGSNDEAYALAVDSNGDIIVAGYYTQVATFGTFTLPNPGLANIFLAKCDAATGAFLWAKSTGNNGDERPLAIDLDAQDNIYVAGFFQSDELVFGGTTLYSVAFDNGFIARYTNTGDPVWAHGLDGDSRARGIVVANNAVYACGDIHEDTLHYGASELVVQGNADLFVLKSSLAGTAQWAAKQTAGGDSGELANGMAADANGQLVVAGIFNSDEITFGSAQLTLSNSWDTFVLRMGDAGVGFAELPGAEAGMLYPNPGADTFILEGMRGIRSVELVNHLGAVVHTAGVQLAQDRIVLHLPGLAPGHYLLRARGDDRNVVKRMVVQ